MVQYRSLLKKLDSARQKLQAFRIVFAAEVGSAHYQQVHINESDIAAPGMLVRFLVLYLMSVGVSLNAYEEQHKCVEG